MFFMAHAQKRFNPHHRFNGSFIPESLSQAVDISPGAKLVWGRFYRYAGNTGGIFPSMTTLAEEVGLGVKQTRRYVHELIENGLVESEQKPGKVRHYYFLEGNVFGPKPDPKPEPFFITDDDDFDTPPVSGSTPVSGRTTPPVSGSTPLPDQGAEESQLRESNEKRQKEPSIISQQPSTEELEPTPATALEIEEDDDTELTVDNISEWVQSIFHAGGRQVATLGSKERQKFLMLVGTDKESLRRKMADWIDSGGRTPADFLKQIPGGSSLSMRREAYRGSVVREKPSVDPDYLSRRSTSPRSFVSQTPTSTTPHSAASRELVERWNKLVPSKPVPFEGTARGYSVSMLEQMTMDAEFMAGFDTMCKKAQAIIANKGDEASWLSFGWLFRIAKDAAEPNWGKLLRGELDMMAAKPKAKGGVNQGMVSAMERLQRQIEEDKKAGK